MRCTFLFTQGLGVAQPRPDTGGVALDDDTERGSGASQAHHVDTLHGDSTGDGSNRRNLRQKRSLPANLETGVDEMPSPAAQPGSGGSAQGEEDNGGDNDASHHGKPLKAGMTGLTLKSGIRLLTSSGVQRDETAMGREGGTEDDVVDAGASSSDEESTADWQGALAAMDSKAEVKARTERKAPSGGKWTKAEDGALIAIVEEHGPKNWRAIAVRLGPTRSDVQCLHRWNKVLRPGLHKGPWTEEEDQVVLAAVAHHGVGQVKWSVIAAQLSGRIGKQVTCMDFESLKLR